MVWFLFALLTAFFESVKDVFSKKSLKNTDEYIVAWSLRFFALPFLLPVLFFVGVPTLGGQFWIALLAGIPIIITTTILYMKALKSSDLSAVVPMVNFTPLFLLITSPLIVGEFPPLLGLLGILLIVLGSYVLNIQKRNEGYMAPFKALLKEKGPRYMLIVAFLWSIGANIDKIGVLNSSPVFWAITTNIIGAIFLFPIMLYKSKKKVKQVSKNLKSLLPIGLFNAFMITFQMIAITLTLVVYVISIKRMSSIISVFFGHLIFKEKGMKERLIGAVIMVVGTLLIALS